MGINTEIITLIASIVVALIGAYPGIRALKIQRAQQIAEEEKLEAQRISERERLEAEITDRVLARAKSQIEDLSRQVDDLQDKLSKAQECIEKLRSDNAKLLKKLEELE